MTDHRPWIYGTDNDDPTPRTPTPGHGYVQLVGGPLDGQLLDVTGFTPDERAEDALLISPHSAYGPGGRSDYSPDGESRWHWNGDTA
ncbi:hypothetical protein [Streptomyces sp. gb14]|uniref:hypothetical protein n=1 Tax=Streptomyces sp. gb14 TaxID=1827753 RepID=UPI000BF08BA4|nr:hypothetical protein [Streptomyces sp. gb14]